MRATLPVTLCCAGGCGYVQLVGQDGITAVAASGGTLSVRVESEVGSP